LNATACENDILAISCDEQDVIHIINAHYGRLDNNVCESNIGTPNTECLFTGARDVVYDRLVTNA